MSYELQRWSQEVVDSLASIQSRSTKRRPKLASASKRRVPIRRGGGKGKGDSDIKDAIKEAETPIKSKIGTYYCPMHDVKGTARQMVMHLTRDHSAYFDRFDDDMRAKLLERFLELYLVKEGRTTYPEKTTDQVKQLEQELDAIYVPEQKARDHEKNMQAVEKQRNKTILETVQTPPKQPIAAPTLKSKAVKLNNVNFATILYGNPRLEWKQNLKPFFMEMGIRHFEELPPSFIDEFYHLTKNEGVSGERFEARLKPFFDKYRMELKRIQQRDIPGEIDIQKVQLQERPQPRRLRKTPPKSTKRTRTKSTKRTRSPKKRPKPTKGRKGGVHTPPRAQDIPLII